MQPFRMTGLLVGVAAIIFAFGPQSGVAMEISPTHFGCDGRGSAENRIDYEPGLSFETAAPVDLRAQQKLPAAEARLGPFNEKRYGFRWVDFFIDTIPIDRSRFEEVSDPPAEVRLIARTRGANGERWWRLRDSLNSGPQSSM